MIAATAQNTNRANIEAIVTGWSKQLGETISAADDDLLSGLLGGVDRSAARKMAKNPRLMSSIARIAAENSYLMPQISTSQGHDDGFLQPVAAKEASSILQAGLSIVALGQVIGREERKALIAEHGEATVQMLWSDGNALLARLSADDFVELRALPLEDRNEAVSAYFSARVVGDGQKPISWNTPKIPFSALDAAFGALKTTGIHLNLHGKQRGLAA